MNDSWFDNNFSEFTDELFESLNYLDLPLEDVEPAGEEEDWRTKFQDVEPPSAFFLPSFSSDICSPSCKDLEKESFQFKQCSPIPEEASYGRSISIQCDSSERNHSQHFRTSSPISVLESSSSSCPAENPRIAKRPRSKGLRSRRCTYELFNPSSFVSRMLPPLGELRSEYDSYLDEKMSSGLVENNRRRKRKKKNLMMRSSGETRECSHCGVSETPQWREGPLGPKTLCNACGVRYRSGRLLPEYRPAASPTFSPSLHSNSHRKVLEMRKKSFAGDNGQNGSTPEANA